MPRQIEGKGPVQHVECKPLPNGRLHGSIKLAMPSTGEIVVDPGNACLTVFTLLVKIYSWFAGPIVSIETGLVRSWWFANPRWHGHGQRRFSLDQTDDDIIHSANQASQVG
jgi:hypothetical protein